MGQLLDRYDAYVLNIADCSSNIEKSYSLYKYSTLVLFHGIPAHELQLQHFNVFSSQNANFKLKTSHANVEPHPHTIDKSLSTRIRFVLTNRSCRTLQVELSVAFYRPICMFNPNV